jgi:hypothetical protein
MPFGRLSLTFTILAILLVLVAIGDPKPLGQRGATMADTVGAKQA